MTQAGSWCDNFTVHESHGLGTCPSTYYTNPNNVHQHLDQDLYLLPSTHVLYIRHHTETEPGSWQRKGAKGLTHFPTGGIEDGAKSQQRSEKVKRKCHPYLVGLLGSDSSRTAELVGFKILQYLSVWNSDFSLVSPMILF